MLQRHTLVTVAREPWRQLIASRDDLADDLVVAAWADHGWPLVARRPCAEDSTGLALGLPLPPSLGKRRISIVMQREDVVATHPPPLLKDARTVAPADWTESIERVLASTVRQTGPVRVFGSLAWQWLTALPYLSATSDLDLLLACAAQEDVDNLTAELADIEATAPMRIDGELVHPDGAAVNWRELHSGTADILVKTMTGVTMVRRTFFLGGLPT